ncbi:DUF6545 domain-containing protein [Pseudonocardia humida]|uniref:DUF6545 domain-containing protein n=1 Tax=Pseudonocardia humida TaxID=2800819 RepID=A0ABT1A1K6_9PSEU|nr:DUF6545 domain-containing protein [Pseudonocardia humida]MCO1656889.1 hypothetical protein [Pseudonocardia humida]
MWPTVVAAALLLAAGLPRLVWGSPSQRALATALCSCAVVLLLELDEVEDLLGPAGLAGPATLAQCLYVTLAAAAAFGMARQVSPTPLRPRVSAAVIGVPIGVLQCALFAVSGLPGAPPTHAQFPEHVHDPAVLGLWAVTAAGPVAAAAVLLPVLRAFGPGLDRLRGRVAVACTFAGLVLVAFAGATMAAQLVVAAVGLPGVERLGAAGAPLAPTGLAVIAAGVLAGRVLAVVQAIRGWVGAHLALRRLDGLARELGAAVPEWGVTTVEHRWAVRKPAGQLYRRVIAIRDASWTLFGVVEGGFAMECADGFARSRRGSLGEQAVAVLAEACWLRYAIEARARGARPPGPGAAHFPERVPEPPGSLSEEADFLVAVARAWRDPLIDEFLAECFPDDCRRQLRTA